MKPPTSSDSFSNDLSPNDSLNKDQATQNPPPLPKSQSVIGGNIKFRGELIGTEDLHIEGTVEGTVIMEGHSLTVGAEGVINANIHASNITINGELTGDVLADELIAIKQTAKVKGNLIAPRIQLDDGGKFRGSMDMVDNEQEKKERTQTFKEKLIHPHLPNRTKSEKPSAAPITAKPMDTNTGNDNNKPDHNKPDHKKNDHKNQKK